MRPKKWIYAGTNEAEAIKLFDQMVKEECEKRGEPYPPEGSPEGQKSGEL